MTDWLQRFEAHSPFHAVVAGCCLAIMAGACVIGLRLRRESPSKEAAFGRALGWSIVAWQSFATIWRVLPAQWDLNESLPMHLCRWNGWIVAVSLISGARWARTLTYFWGLGLSVHGMITPMWTDGAGTVAFWLYWVGHLQIVGVAVYDLVVRRYMPTWPDLRFTLIAGVAYALLTGTLNKVLGTNYSYLGDWDYQRASIVDRLGDYPERMFAMCGGALLLFVLMYFATRLVRWTLARSAGEDL